ncbi:MAG: S-adenosyl-l-methionine hydroxide adenosyltransferase family protein [Blastocatellales bacterium]
MFAPVAAHIARGVKPEEIGEEIEDYVRFETPRPRLIESQGVIEGSVIHIDRFGNCITSFTEADLRPDAILPSTKLYFGGREIRQFGSHFAEAADRDDLFAYLGSAGFWEIALWCGSAAKSVNARRGDEVIFEQ